MTEEEKEGMKFDVGKLRWDLLPLEVSKGVVKILTYGAQKYKPNNWQKVEMWRYKAAFMRHYEAWLSGEENDKESGLHHLDHAMCNLYFIRWKILHGVP